MKRILWYGLFSALLAVGFACLHGTAEAASCQLNQTSLPDLIANYDPVTATSGATLTINSGVLAFTCTGLAPNGSANHVHILVSGSTVGYTGPSLVGPSFTLTYNLCLPGSASCTSSTNVWGNGSASTSDYDFTSGITNGASTPIPSFLIFLGKQDAYIGTTAQYLGSLYFSFVCGEGSNKAAC